jgi:CVNH domain
MRSHFAIALGAMCFVFALGGKAQAAPSGSYLSSCRNVHMTGQVLNAQCTTASGIYVSTSLNLQNCPNGPVGNNGGKLFCEGSTGGPGWRLPAGSWQTSCRNGRAAGHQFIAECPNNQSRWVNSSLFMPNCPSRLVGNNNGQLFCEGGGSNPGWRPGNLPGGSWRTSCKDMRMNGWVVHASCTNNQSAWRAASFNMNNCPGWALGNRDGNLFCEAGDTGFGRLPGGSWQNSCRAPNMNGHFFSAQCSANGGGYRRSQIDMRNCPRRLVGNRNGQLFCEGPGYWGMMLPGGRQRVETR